MKAETRNRGTIRLKLHAFPMVKSPAMFQTGSTTQGPVSENVLDSMVYVNGHHGNQTPIIPERFSMFLFLYRKHWLGFTYRFLSSFRALSGIQHLQPLRERRSSSHLSPGLRWSAGSDTFSQKTTENSGLKTLSKQMPVMLSTESAKATTWK